MQCYIQTEVKYETNMTCFFMKNSRIMIFDVCTRHLVSGILNYCNIYCFDICSNINKRDRRDHY